MLVYSGNAYATLLRSESFDGIQYIKSFIKADKESIVTNETVDFENTKIDEQYPYAAMLLKYYRKSLEDHRYSAINMLNSIYCVESAIDLEENRRNRENERVMSLPIMSGSIGNEMQLRTGTVNGVPVLMTGDSVSADSTGTEDGELKNK